MLSRSIAASLLLASSVCAGGLLREEGTVYRVRRDNGVEEAMRRYVDAIVEPVQRRQSTEGTGAVNLTQWDNQTAAACTTSLEALGGVASNPSGMAVCYNLPFLDNTTGVFQADLRLYTISAPTGDFANISTQDVQVSMSYDGATVQAVNASSLKRSNDISLISWPRGVEKRDSVPTLSQSYAFVGQINSNLLGTNMGTAALQKVLVPTVTLNAVNSTGQNVNTTLSSNEATFVSGVFASEVVPTKSEVSPPIQTLVVASESPFVVPGLKILIAPIGAIITGAWVVLLASTIAYGTIGRIQFREQYRRRSAIANKGGMARI